MINILLEIIVSLTQWFSLPNLLLQVRVSHRQITSRSSQVCSVLIFRCVQNQTTFINTNSHVAMATFEFPSRPILSVFQNCVISYYSKLFNTTVMCNYLINNKLLFFQFTIINSEFLFYQAVNILMMIVAILARWYSPSSLLLQISVFRRQIPIQQSQVRSFLIFHRFRNKPQTLALIITYHGLYFLIPF